jgi:hypothetical protein
MLSGPQALCGFRFADNLLIPVSLMCIGEGEDLDLYRPISLTCICCKLMEHIISSNIMSHLENNKILYNLQHGFRKARSCETQLIDFIQELAKSNNCSKQTDLIIMDFAKAFDKVPHCRLRYKLKFYGIQKDILNWNKLLVICMVVPNTAAVF